MPDTLVFHFDGTVTAKGAATAPDAAMNSAATVTLDANGQDGDCNAVERRRKQASYADAYRRQQLGRPRSRARSILLLGDANATRRVTAADIAGVSQFRKTINAGNAATARYDLEFDGSISSADISPSRRAPEFRCSSDFTGSK